LTRQSDVIFTVDLNADLIVSLSEALLEKNASHPLFVHQSFIWLKWVYWLIMSKTSTLTMFTTDPTDWLPHKWLLKDKSWWCMQTGLGNVWRASKNHYLRLCL